MSERTQRCWSKNSVRCKKQYRRIESSTRRACSGDRQKRARAKHVVKGPMVGVVVIPSCLG